MIDLNNEVQEPTLEYFSKLWDMWKPLLPTDNLRSLIDCDYEIRYAETKEPYVSK